MEWAEFLSYLCRSKVKNPKIAMLSFQEAKQLLNEIPFHCSTEQRKLSDCLGLYLAEEITTEHPIPIWSNSAMDGYACRHDDLVQGRTSLQIVCDIAAGHPVDIEIQSGQCARIMTGAPLPRGTDTVVIQENTTRSSTFVHIVQVPAKQANVRQQGEECSKGSVLLPMGVPLSPSSLALAASTGKTTLPVYRPPKIGIIATGDELQPVGAPLQFGQIWSTNTLSLSLSLQQLGFTVIDCGIAKDTLQSTKAAFSKALQEQCDIILSTGGVSVGDFDVVKDALQDFDVQMKFCKVRMKPGKPIAVGSIETTPIFALPGNPVSCMISFYQFVRPFILRGMNAHQTELPEMVAILDEDIHKRHGRMEFMRMIVERRDSVVYTRKTGSQSSAWLSSLSKADALLPIAPDCHVIPKGSTVTVQLIP